ncbi:MAG: endonuclease Q family protein [Promethearchaeota archaeon]
MDEYNADFHLHGPHSIGVSKDMSLPSLLVGARQKGLHLVGTGDCLQPDWLAHLKENLEFDGGAWQYKDVSFILQTEVEDVESVHHVVLLPDFKSIDELKESFSSHSPNLEAKWGGRPRVNLPPAEIVEKVTDAGGLVGPAHAFTPFKSIFRQGKFDSLYDAFAGQAKNVFFIELGLSANSEYADQITDLHRLTFMTNSDAHSPTPQSLGREFNTFVADGTSFDEVDQAIRRKNGRKFTRNVGMDPRLGKYNVLFCHSCRRRVIVKARSGKNTGFLPIMDKVKFNDELILHEIATKQEYFKYLENVSNGKVFCPACQMQKKKKSKIKLGVSERVKILSDAKKGTHPDHRPPYIGTVPLTEILRVAMGIKSPASKTLGRIYVSIIDKYGSEIDVLLQLDLEVLRKSELQASLTRYPALFATIADILGAFRENKVKFKPGGGGAFGELVFDS